MAAWDHNGRFDTILGPMTKFTVDEFEEWSLPRKQKKKQLLESAKSGCKLMTSPALDFAINVAPRLFSKAARSADHTTKLLKTLMDTAPYWEDIKVYLGNTS